MEMKLLEQVMSCVLYRSFRNLWWTNTNMEGELLERTIYRREFTRGRCGQLEIAHTCPHVAPPLNRERGGS